MPWWDDHHMTLLPWRRHRGPDAPAHAAEVWRVRQDPPARRKRHRHEPYLVAYCPCGWVGTAHDASDPEAETKARTEAFTHSPTVAEGAIDITV